MERVLASKSTLICGLSQEHYRVFAKRATLGMSKSQRRLFREMVWGMLMSRSVTLSKIAGWIAGTGTRLLSRVKRLSRGLRGDWEEERVRQNHLHAMGAMVGQESSVVIDISDIRKERGEKFEYLSRVRDGSTGETVTGYQFITVTGVLGRQYHESLNNVTPEDVYCGRHQEIISRRERLKRRTLKTRKLYNLSQPIAQSTS